MANPELLVEQLMFAIRLLLVLTLPILVILAITGTISGILQAVTGVREELINYLLKFVAFVFLCFFYVRSFLNSFQELFEALYL